MQLASFDELYIVVPYFTAVFVLSNAVEHKFIGPTDCFTTGGWCVHAPVEFNTISKTLLLYRDYTHYEPDISEIELPKINRGWSSQESLEQFFGILEQSQA